MSTDLAVRSNGNGAAPALLPAANDWAVMLQMADVLFKSGMLPQHIKSPQAAVAIIQKGRELGIPPMQSMAGIACIQGKPTAGAELMLALVYRDHGDDAMVFEETTGTRCTLSYKRRSWRDRKTFSFTLDDAKQAGLLGNQTWQKYPAAMLRARCISAVARLVFPDSIGGMYTAEELGAHVTVDADGVIEVQDIPHQRTDYGPSRYACQCGELVDERMDACPSCRAWNPSKPNPHESTSDPISEKTMKHLHAVGRQKGVTHTGISKAAKKLFGVESTKDLTEAQAVAMIAELTQRPDKPEEPRTELKDEDEPVSHDEAIEDALFEEQSMATPAPNAQLR